MKYILLLLGCVFIIFSSAFSQGRRNQRPIADGADVLDRLEVLKGSVLVLNPDGTVGVRVGAYIVFQRANCALCLVAVHSDLDGKYSIILGRGKYKVFVFEMGDKGQSYNALASGQSHFVKVERPRQGYFQTFDIKIALHQLPTVLDFELELEKGKKPCQ